MYLGRNQLREARAALEDLSSSFLALRLSSIREPSLASGLAGLALAYVALDAAFPGAGHAARAQRVLSRAIEGLANSTPSPSLYSGFTGIAWVAELLAGDPNAAPEDDVNAEIDTALEAYLAASPWKGPYDLIDGVVGIGVYALERMPRSSAKRLLALAVSRLQETARPKRPGIAWQSDPRWIPPQWRRTTGPDWNLGVAHGVPGAVAMLGRVAAAAVDPSTQKTACALVDGAVAWLLAQELPPHADGRFGYRVARGVSRSPARLAWCYGDAGIAAALLVAARAMGERAWGRAALRIARHAAARTEATAGVMDAGLCHGAAGLAHIFHRIYLATGEENIAAAARTWFRRTLAMRTPGQGFAGFRTYHAMEPAWRGEPGFLTGSAGVTLALLAATTDSDCAWDRALLLS